MNQGVSDFSFHPLLTRLTYHGSTDLSHRYLVLLRVQTWTQMISLFFFRFSKLAGILLFCLQKQHIKHHRTYGPTAILSIARLFNNMNSFYLWVIMDWHFLGVLALKQLRFLMIIGVTCTLSRNCKNFRNILMKY